MNLVLGGLTSITFFTLKIKIDLEDKIVNSIFRKGVDNFILKDKISECAQSFVLIKQLE